MKRLAWLIAIGLCLQLSFSSSAQSAPESPIQVKELNFVFLHGAGGSICSLQLLDDAIRKQLPSYILDYEQANPSTKVRVDTLGRCYPNNVDINTWANNIAHTIDEHFHNKKNLILIGHSMGGKAAIHAVAQNIGGLADKVVLVVTINSPIKSLQKYYVTGGGSILDYCRTRWLLADQGVCNSVGYFDSSQEGRWMGYNKHWLAFVSGEAMPLSEQFNIGGVDPMPRNIDDGIIPISAQYADWADVIYYGEYGHSDFNILDEVAEFMAGQILRYLFGGQIECSILARGGNFQHQASWLPVTGYWEDVVGEVPATSDRLYHKNESYTKWQEWEDVVSICPAESKRSSYQIRLVRFFPFLTSIQEARWFSPDNPEDCRLYLRTRAAPRSSVKVDWSIYQQGLLPQGTKRDRYEVDIVTGTPFTSVGRVSWVTDDPRDLRLRIWSQAQGPFRWFKAEWRAYSKESRERKIIDEILGEALPATVPASQNTCCQTE